MIILLSLDSYIFARNICYGGGLPMYNNGHGIGNSMDEKNLAY